MELEIKPKVLETVSELCKDYNKLLKYQKEKLQCILNSTNFSSTKDKVVKKLFKKYLEKLNHCSYHHPY